LNVVDEDLDEARLQVIPNVWKDQGILHRTIWGVSTKYHTLDEI